MAIHNSATRLYAGASRRERVGKRTLHNDNAPTQTKCVIRARTAWPPSIHRQCTRVYTSTRVLTHVYIACASQAASLGTLVDLADDGDNGSASSLIYTARVVICDGLSPVAMILAKSATSCCR